MGGELIVVTQLQTLNPSKSRPLLQHESGQLGEAMQAPRGDLH